MRLLSAFSAALALILFRQPVIASNITGVWANEGGDKVAQEELRATRHVENLTGKVINRTWDGHTIILYGAQNEVISFNLVLEAGGNAAGPIKVTFDTLVGPNGTILHSNPTNGNGVFNFVNRPIELFYLRYLPVNGLSYFGYNARIEAQVPVRFRVTNGVGGWTSRPDHDMMYPDVMVPLELVPTFTIAGGKSQSVWADIYIPKTLPPGIYKGNVVVDEGGATVQTIPVQMTVYDFALPDAPSSKAMFIMSTGDVMQRYVAGRGGYFGPASPEGTRVRRITDQFFKLFHRHKLSVLGDDDCATPGDAPCATGVSRLDGTLFTANNGYDGPGVGVGNGIYSIGTYGTWGWRYNGNEAIMWQHANNWVNWFQQNLPGVEHFIYLQDEPGPADYPQVETWSKWIAENPGPGRKLLSMSTLPPVLARRQVPDLAVPVFGASIGNCDGPAPCSVTSLNQSTADYYRSAPGKQFWAYNDSRPGTGTADLEADGTDLRELSWGQYKMKVQWWMYWFINPDPPGDWMNNPITWGTWNYQDASLGQWYNKDDNSPPALSNGLFVYPGTDLYNPQSNYGVDGPFASMRLKAWRRGVQDVDYITLAARADPVATNAIVNRVIPKVLWEYPSQDPTYYPVGPSWSSDPDDWETARAQLAILAAQGARIRQSELNTNEAPPLLPTVYPNPWRKDTAIKHLVTFGNLRSGVDVRIFTVSGYLVKRLPIVPDGETITKWDLTNKAGQEVASGLYLYSAQDPQGAKATGKLAVVR